MHTHTHPTPLVLLTQHTTENQLVLPTAHHITPPSVRRPSMAHLFALVTNVVGIFVYRIFRRLLVVLGVCCCDRLALGEVLVLQSEKSLPLHVLVQFKDRVQHVFQTRMGNGDHLQRGRGKIERQTCVYEGERQPRKLRPPHKGNRT